jgi:glycosyltransferase involved in cell wall biosynthesis
VTTGRLAPHAARDSEATKPLIRVLWLIKGFGPGGAERLVVLAARARDRSRLAVRAAYLLPHKVALVPEMEAEGVPVTCLGSAHLADPRWIWRLRRSLIEAPVDIVHAHSPLAAVGARVVIRTLPRSRRPAMVTTDHNVWASHGRMMRWADAATCGLDDAHITVSDAVRSSMPERFRRHAEVIEHGVDVAQVRRDGAHRDEVRTELGIPPDALVVGTVANLRAAKDYPNLLAAARLVVTERPEVRFVAVGQGPLEAEIREQITRMGLDGAFLLLGYRSDAVRVMGACDIFCLGSLHEGLPLALMEALALGLPVVSTDVGGIREMVESGREAILVPSADAAALATALLSVLSDSQLRETMAAEAAKQGDSRSIGHAVERTEAIYSALALR